ncbi:hypothetical protein [Kitasatospora atroaurantiaca]|uniref:PknH-like protein n=1 Tax=Kitasatospora atroaurantiaca TaxID=285545 RepID=A0A561ENU3_9ACTN|nr:hypothetical protein [Kitasatospora atroaurantiaca]TWE17294.1 hypothetical protein FB465_2302 [Kitasatospora atroaurantiaca]
MSTPTDAGPGYGSFPGRPSGYGPPPPPVSSGPAPVQARPAASSSRRSLLWGVAGALVASVVWATAVITVPGIVTTGGKAPGLGGYRVVDDLCTTARFTRFTQLYPAQSGTPYHYSTRHAAMDDMYCSKYLKKSSSDTEYSSLYLEAQLHKAVDPRQEFEAQKSSLQQRKYQISEVPSLGEQAYIGYLDDPSSSDRTWHYLTQVLYVRDGGLTYYLSWSGSYQEGKGTPPDRDTIRQALLMDSRDVLKAIGGA